MLSNARWVRVRIALGMFEILSTIAHLHRPTARVALRAPGEMESLGFPAHCTYYYTRDVARFGLYRDV